MLEIQDPDKFEMAFHADFLLKNVPPVSVFVPANDWVYR